MLTTSEPGYAVIRSFEGRSLKAYRDEVGVWTIGYGNTNYDAEVLGFDIKAGVTISAAQAEQLLKAAMVRRYEPAVREAMGPSCTQAAFDAGGSFHYNTGAIKRASWVKSYVAKNLPAVHSQITLWNKAGGKALAGLTRRRNREWEMIDQSNYGPEGRTAPVDMTTGKPVSDPASHVPAGTARPGPYPGMIIRGDNGPEVRDEQLKLVAVGYDVPLTGTFEDKTEYAVRDFQTRHPQLRSDGVLGPATKTALKREADLKAKLTKKAGASTGAAVVATSADQVAGGWLPWEAYAGLGLVVVAVLAWTVWQYRDEFRTMLKAKFTS